MWNILLFKYEGFKIRVYNILHAGFQGWEYTWVLIMRIRILIILSILDGVYTTPPTIGTKPFARSSWPIAKKMKFISWAYKCTEQYD